MNCRLILSLSLVAAVAFASPAGATVLCARKKASTGAFQEGTPLKLRATTCKPSEVAVDPVTLGLQGPPGSAGPQGPTGATGPAEAPAQCPPDAVQLGSVCVDRFEASVWEIPTGSSALLAAVLAGEATAGDLTTGATQFGPASTAASCSGAEYPAAFPPNGSWTTPLYAVSVPGVLPSTCITWFQAAQACRLAGKRLLANSEWQDAAVGTPDPGLADDGFATCVTNSSAPTTTGARAGCVSNWGVQDLVGNVFEWVADWSELSLSVETHWPAGPYATDFSSIGGNGSGLPSALTRGGEWFGGTNAGVFEVSGGNLPSNAWPNYGFRCGRDLR